MHKPNTALPIQETAENGTPFESGNAAGRAALAGLSQFGPLSSEQAEWLSGFLKAFVEAGASTSSPACIGTEERQPASNRSPKIPAYVAVDTTPYTARITQVEVGASSNGALFATVMLDIEGSQLTYGPGSTLALWPSNDPEEVRKVLRALGVSAQLQVATTRGSEPAWQVLLERVSLSKLSRGTIELLAEYSKSESEAQGLFALSDADPLQLEGRALLSVLRRFPSTRPPLDRLLASLQPLEPTLVPIASSAVDSPTRLQFTAHIVDEPKGWGELSVSAKARFREGEWVTVSVDAERAPLPVEDELVPVIVIAEGPCIALARALVAERMARKAKGRSWVIGLGIQTSTIPFAREFMSWQKTGTLGRYDSTPGVAIEEMIRLLEEKEETLWRWLIDQSEFCVLTTKLDVRQAVEQWLTAAIMRRQRIGPDAAKARVHELRAAHRYVEHPDKHLI